MLRGCVTFWFFQVPDHETNVKISVAHLPLLQSRRGCTWNKFWFHSQRRYGKNLVFQLCPFFERPVEKNWVLLSTCYLVKWIESMWKPSLWTPKKCEPCSGIHCGRPPWGFIFVDFIYI